LPDGHRFDPPIGISNGIDFEGALKKKLGDLKKRIES